MSEPRKTVIESTFELLAGFVVNRFYNDIYASAAEKFNRKNSASITTTYVDLISTYARAIDDPTYIPNEIKMLLDFYQAKTAFTSITLREMEDKICSCFVPPDHFSAMASHDKDRVTIDILAHIIKLTANFIINGGIGGVIDDRGNSIMHVRKLMDANVVWLSEKRENLYKRFASHVIAAGSYRRAPPNEAPDVMEKMRMMIAEKIRENGDLITHKEKTEQLIPAMQRKIKELMRAAETASQDLARGRLEFERARQDYETRLANATNSPELREENARLRNELAARGEIASRGEASAREECAALRLEAQRLRADYLKLQADYAELKKERETVQEEKNTSNPRGLLDSDSESGDESDSDDAGLYAKKRLEEKMRQ